MTTRVALLPYGPSDSCRLLRDELATVYQGNPNIRPRLLRTEHSTFRGNQNDIIINYGNRSAPAEVFGNAITLNPRAALNNAANKLTALNRMRNAGVSTIEFTDRIEEARQWAREGALVYQRNVLNGHSGEGIEIFNAGNHTGMNQSAPLFTKGIGGQRREWRVHVFKGIITFVQVKRRRNGYQDDPEYREDVRNHHTGWIYATENINPNDAVLWNAVQAVQSLSLDFGAVDIISRGQEAWVLEVNTAAGLSGTTLEIFTRNVVEFVNSTVESRPGVYVARFAAPMANPNPRVVEEAPAVEEAPVAVTAAPSSIQMEQVEFPEQGRINDNTNRDVAEGYYVASVRNRGGTTQNNVIVFRSGNRWFRHGWNAPIDGVTNYQRIGSVTLPNGNTISMEVTR